MTPRAGRQPRSHRLKGTPRRTTPGGVFCAPWQSAGRKLGCTYGDRAAATSLWAQPEGGGGSPTCRTPFPPPRGPALSPGGFFLRGGGRWQAKRLYSIEALHFWGLCVRCFAGRANLGQWATAPAVFPADVRRVAHRLVDRSGRVALEPGRIGRTVRTC